jgi:hypothetical protein
VATALAGGVHGLVVTAGVLRIMSIIAAHLIPADARADGEGISRLPCATGDVHWTATQPPLHVQCSR